GGEVVVGANQALHRDVGGGCEARDGFARVETACDFFGADECLGGFAELHQLVQVVPATQGGNADRDAGLEEFLGEFRQSAFALELVQAAADQRQQQLLRRHRVEARERVVEFLGDDADFVGGHS